MPHRTLCLLVGLTFATLFMGCGGSTSESVNTVGNEQAALPQETASLRNQSGEISTTASPTTSSESSTPYVDPSDDPVIQARRRRYSQSSSEFKSNATDGEAAGEKLPKAGKGSELKSQGSSDAKSEASKREFVKMFAPEVIEGMSVDEFLRKHSDASRNDIRSNPDGSKEIIWGDNFVSHHAAFLNGKVFAYRWKVVRFSKADAEKEMKRPYEALGNPDSNVVPANEPDIIAWNDWIVSDFLVSTGVRVGKTVNGSPLYFAERHVVNQTLLDQALKGSVPSTPNQSTSVGSKPKATDTKAGTISEPMSGGKTRSEWTTILLKGDSETRKKAIAALTVIGDHPKETLDALEAALQGMDSDVARLAAMALGKSGDAGIDRLISGLAFPEDGVRAACMTALVTERNPNTVPALMKLLDHSEKATAVAASTVLMSMGEKAVPELIKGLSGRGVQARGWAAIVLGKIGPSAKSAIPRLKTMLDDPYPPNRAIAADALSKIDR